MIRVFSPNDKIFTSNGDVVIRPLKAKLHIRRTQIFSMKRQLEPEETTTEGE